MNQADTLNIEAAFSFSELNKNVAGISEKKIFRFEKNQANRPFVKPINNYLKTPEEMDAEFSLEMNANKSILKEHIDIFDTYGRIIKNTDILIYSYSTDDTHSGFMEENY